MPVNIRMPDILAERSRSGQLRLAKPHREGLTAGDVVAEEGFSREEAEAILVMVNGVQADRSTPVRDGDTVELVIQMVGGGF
jgi:sulfur carrier protein ThiS